LEGGGGEGVNVVLEVEPFEKSRRYATPEERDAALAPLEATFAGRMLDDMWTDTWQWVLEFSGPLWLRVFVDGDMVGWSVERERPAIEAIAVPEQYDLGGGIIGVPDPGKFAAARRGVRFFYFSVVQNGFTICVAGNHSLRPLCFQIVRRRDTGEYRLYVWEL
jgi:hypothetical protein